MKEFIENNLDLILYIALGVLGLVLIIVLLAIFVFKPLKLKKMLAELDSKYQFCHALLIGQDSQFIKRLEIISRTNLLYVDTHTNFARRFKEIRDRFDINSSSVINRLKDNLDEKDYKTFVGSYKDAVKTVKLYEDTVNKFSAELAKVVKPEDDCRQAALEYKNQLRATKQDFYSKESELGLMSNSFEQVFEYIDSLFKNFEEAVDSAHYDDANTILPKIAGILKELNTNLRQLPSLCALISNIVPDKIHEIEKVYKEMVDEHYPLHHLFVTQTIDSMNNCLKECTDKIKNFDIEGIEQVLNEIQEKLDEFLVKFQAEKDSRVIFEEKNEKIYSDEIVVEKRFITLRNVIPEISAIYIIDEDHNKKINDLQKEVNRVGSLKRSLDTYVHSSTKQPYILLVNKMNELEEAIASITTNLDEFDAYTNSLKDDAERAYELVYSSYYKVKTAEETVRVMNIASVKAKYTPAIERLYSLLNDINLLLVNQPINIQKVNELIRDLYETSNKLLDDGEIAQDYNMMVLAESAIMYGNKHRNHLADIDQILTLAEVHFNNGDFEQANETAKIALNKIKQNNGR